MTMMMMTMMTIIIKTPLVNHAQVPKAASLQCTLRLGMRQGQDVVEGRRSSQVNLEVQLVTNKAIYLSGTSTT